MATAAEVGEYWRSLAEEDDDEAKKKGPSKGATPEQMLEGFLQHSDKIIEKFFDKAAQMYPELAKEIGTKADAKAIANNLRNLMAEPGAKGKQELNKEQLTKIQKLCDHPTMKELSAEYGCDGLKDKIAAKANEALKALEKKEKDLEALSQDVIAAPPLEELLEDKEEDQEEDNEEDEDEEDDEKDKLKGEEGEEEKAEEKKSEEKVWEELQAESLKDDEPAAQDDNQNTPLPSPSPSSGSH